MNLIKICGKGGEWITEQKEHPWNLILTYWSPIKAEVNGQEVACFAFAHKVEENKVEPLWLPVSLFPKEASIFLTAGKQYIIFRITQDMIKHFEEKYKEVPEQEWPKGLKEMLFEQTLVFEIGQNEVKESENK